MTWKPLSEQEIESIGMVTGSRNIGCITYNKSVDNRDSGMRRLAPTCPTSNKNVGDIVHMSASPTGGTAPYTVPFKKGIGVGAILLKQFTGVTEGQNVTYDYTILAEDAGKTFILSNSTIDSCILGAKICSEQCSITVNAVACVPNWQCEQPPNGYMSDGCGNRKLDISCILPTCGNPVCNLVVT